MVIESQFKKKKVWENIEKWSKHPTNMIHQIGRVDYRYLG